MMTISVSHTQVRREKKGMKSRQERRRKKRINGKKKEASKVTWRPVLCKIGVEN